VPHWHANPGGNGLLLLLRSWSAFLQTAEGTIHGRPAKGIRQMSRYFKRGKRHRLLHIVTEGQKGFRPQPTDEISTVGSVQRLQQAVL